MAAPKFLLITLGCPKNEVDSDRLASRLMERGYLRTGRCDDADVIIVNTCSFVQKAVEESLETIFDIAAMKPEKSRLLVTGCLYQRYGEKLRSLLPEVDGFFRPEETPLERGEKYDPYSSVKVEGVSNNRISDRTVFSGIDKGYVYVKISEGCDRACSFCTIPMIKGRMRSREPAELIREALEAIHCGAKELVLVSQDSSSYGRDLGIRNGLEILLRSLADLPGDFRLRIMYLQPDNVSDSLLDMLTHPKVCSYLDVPFQHVNPNVLRAMGRRGGAQEFRELVVKARELIPGIAVRSAFITGFPGEDRRAFLELLDFIEEVRLDWLAVFPFSPEEGTPGSRMRCGCSRSTAARRADELLRAQEEIMREKAESLRGATFRVLVEGPSEMAPGFHEARSHREAPEIDGIIFIPSRQAPTSPQFREASIVDAEGIDLLGRIVA